MNKALNALKEANPTLFAQFMNLLAEDLGLPAESSSGSLTCPSCHAEFQVALSQAGSKSLRRTKREKVITSRGQKRKWNPGSKSLFGLLVTVAKLRKATTGRVSAEFNKAMAAKIKGRTPEEVREVKIKWLTDQIAKSRSKRKAA